MSGGRPRTGDPQSLLGLPLPTHPLLQRLRRGNADGSKGCAMPNSTRNASSRTPSRVKNTTTSRSGSRGSRGSRGSGSRLGGTGHVELIPFRPHHSWWVQLLLLLWRWTPELLLLASTIWYLRRTSREGWPGWVQLALPLVVLAAF